MTKQEKIVKIANHIEKHPNDYQSIISYYKLRSEQIAWEMEQRKIARLRKISECRRILNERKQKAEQNR